jgi:hypothetical protein
MSNYNMLPDNTTKFRETSADSVVFHLAGHTPELPRTLTQSRILPTPRKGNAGTCKTFLNARVTSNIGSVENPVLVPTIVKLEISCPVGSTSETVHTALTALEGLTAPSHYSDVNSSDARDDLLLSGYLLDNLGTELSKAFFPEPY